MNDLKIKEHSLTNSEYTYTYICILLYIYLGIMSDSLLEKLTVSTNFNSSMSPVSTTQLPYNNEFNKNSDDIEHLISITNSTAKQSYKKSFCIDALLAKNKSDDSDNQSNNHMDDEKNIRIYSDNIRENTSDEGTSRYV